MPKLIKKDESIEVFEMSYKEIKKCPNVIFLPSHYTKNSCYCFDKNAIELKKDGYKWNSKKGHWN